MYAYTFLYPRPKTRSFDYAYHLDVHMPMGLAVTKRFLDIEPKSFIVERIAEEDPASSEPYAAIVHLLFERKADLAALATLPAIRKR